MGQLGLLCKYLQWEKQAENGKAVGNPKGGNTATNIRPPKGIKGDDFIKGLVRVEIGLKVKVALALQGKPRTIEIMIFPWREMGHRATGRTDCKV